MTRQLPPDDDPDVRREPPLAGLPRQGGGLPGVVAAIFLAGRERGAREDKGDRHRQR